jgi:hypothetical protein
MPIIFTNASHPNLTTDTGTPGLLTYIGRFSMWDPRLEKRLDFTRLRSDLVYSGLWLPEGAPPEFADIEQLSIENDAAEMRRVRNLAGSLRPPQIGVALITALPPDGEVTLDEAREIGWRILHEARQRSRLPVYLAIHDPGLQSPGAKNRHGHGFMLTREVGPGGLAPRKIRTGIAAVRRGYVAEGIHWPNLTSEVLRTHLLECGTDIPVDPVAPFPQKHLRPAGRGSNTGRLAFHRAQLMDKNVAAIYGHPCELLTALLRRRSTLEIEELRAFLAKCIDSWHDRERALDRILSHSDVLAFADEANANKARFVTTAAIHASIEYAVHLVDRSKRGDATIHAAIGANEDGVTAAINAVLKDRRIENASDLLIVGNRRSDCAAMAEVLASTAPAVATLKQVLVSASTGARPRKRRALPALGLVIVPHAERLADQDLAELFALADQAEAEVILGKDLSVETGVVVNRLACYAVDRLTTFRVISEQCDSPERLLRAGLTATAVKLMSNQLTFKAIDKSPEDRDQFDFTVCTNATAVKVADEALRRTYGEKCAKTGMPPFVAELTHGPVLLWPWQPVVFSRTDYSVLPPKVREGQLATIFSKDPRPSTIQAQLPDGEIIPISTRRFPWLRSGFALSIREARQIKDAANLRIELGDARRAWPALVLAASRPRTASVIVDPSVARNVDSLAMMLSASLPGALSTDLKQLSDSIIGVSTESSWTIEDFPVPRSPKSPSDPLGPLLGVLANGGGILPSEDSASDGFEDVYGQVVERGPPGPPLLLAANVRELLASDDRSARSFALLAELLHSDSEHADAVAEKLQGTAHPLTMHIVNQLREAYLAPQRARLTEEDEIELPADLRLETPDPWSLGQLKLDLSCMTVRASYLDISAFVTGRTLRF